MRRSEFLSLETVRAIISYDERQGTFAWKAPRGKKIWAGKPIRGSDNGHGYLSVVIAGRRYYLHRLAWFYVHGVWPYEIDHINAIKSDNRIENLRECKHHENQQNIPVTQKRLQKSGFIGANPERRTGRWYARIKVSGKTVHLGTFSTPAQASQAYLNAKAIYHTLQPTPRYVGELRG